MQGLPKQGVLQRRDGTWYEGGWENGASAGTGTLKKFQADGAVYFGAVEGGVAQGHGTRRAKNGSSYTGEWKDGLPEGRGKEVAADLSSYDGAWLAGRRQGQGVWRRANPGWTDATVYENIQGHFEDGVPEGPCEVSCDDGSVMDITYQKGRPLIGRDPHQKGSKAVTVRWGDAAAWTGWMDDGLLDSKKASKEGLATGTLAVSAGTVEGQFRHRLGNAVLRWPKYFPAKYAIRTQRVAYRGGCSGFPRCQVQSAISLPLRGSTW